MARFFLNYAFEICLVVFASSILIAGFFIPRAVVVENVAGSGDTRAMSTAEPLTTAPTPPPVDAIAGMRKVEGDTPHSIDSLDQSGTRVLLVTRPPSASITRDTPVTFSGWAIDGAHARPPAAIFITFDRKAVTSCLPTISRPDVAAALKLPDIDTSGFSCVVPPARLSPGKYVLGIDVATPERTYYAQQSPTTIIVR